MLIFQQAKKLVAQGVLPAGINILLMEQAVKTQE